MTAIPSQVSDALKLSFPLPSIDPEWMTACIDYLHETLTATRLNIPLLISEITSQLLQSNLSDSMIHFTGLPRNISPVEFFAEDVPTGQQTLNRTVLVEILSITEISASAFTLAGVKQAREDREDLGLDQGKSENDRVQEDEDQGPIPKYPRSMLRFILSDGSVTLNAIEYKRLPEIELGVTPLGYKMLLLPNLVVRRGVAYLSPTTVQLKGYQTEDHEINQWSNFDRHLRLRRGIPEPVVDEVQQPSATTSTTAPLPVRGRNIESNSAQRREIVPQVESRSPLRTITPPDRSMDLDFHAANDNPVQMRHQKGGLVSSKYFTGTLAGPPIPDLELAADFRTSGTARIDPLPASSSTLQTQDSDDFGFNDEIDEELLQALADAESSTLVPSATIITQLASGDAVIEIDSEEDDKENVPVQRRRVRPRRTSDADVIDISD